MIDLAKANRQMVAERQALLAERDRLQNELNQRYVDEATAAIRGLGVLVELAKQGNPAARLAVNTLAETLEQARALRTGIVLAGN